MNIPVKRNGEWLYATLGLVKYIENDEVLVLEVKGHEVKIPSSNSTVKMVQKMLQVQDFVLLPFLAESKTLLIEDIETNDTVLDEWKDVENHPLV